MVDDQTRIVAHLSRNGPGRRQDLCHAGRGSRPSRQWRAVVVGWIERHGRDETRTQLGDLKVFAPRTVQYRGSFFVDLDVQSVAVSGADLVLVDELAHWVPDTRRSRWEEVADLLAAGLDVLTTTNVANLESVRDYAARLTGMGTVECVPDEFVRSGEVVLIDLPADVLRRRIASGNVYSADQVGGALADYFRASNLEALSELGQAWMAGNVEAVGDDLLTRRGLIEPPSRQLVLAGVSGSKSGERVIRNAAELAREDDADLLVVHVRVADGSAGLASRRSRELERNRELTGELGGTYAEIQGDAAAEALADTARVRGASRVVVANHRSRLGKERRRAVAARLHRLLGDAIVDEVRDDDLPPSRQSPQVGQQGQTS